MVLSVLHVVLCLVVGGSCWTYPPSVDPSSSTRLVGSGVPWEGRLEVYYNGEWGAVCSNGFDFNDARVACYSMGYGRIGYDIGNAYLPATGRIWLDWVGCNGYESWIGECPNSGWGQTSCGQWSVISVRCSGGTDETSLPPTTVAYATAAVANPTRLAGSGYPDRGRVEVYYNGQWGTVCDDSFDNVDAQVVCYSLGFGRVGRAVLYDYAGGSGQIWLDEVQCNGYETFVGDCPHRGWGVHDCTHSEDVGVVCSSSTDTMTTAGSRTVDYYTGDPSQVTRLVGSGWPDRGRVEVLNQNTWEWGTVCKDNFDDTDARVVCFSLGYGYNGQFIGNTYGQGSGPIWLDEVRCVGTETFIGNCPHNGWGVTDCGHYEDVSVECYSTSPSTAAWPVTSESTTQSPQTTTYTVNPYWSTRLVGSGWSGEGRLEVLYNGQWGAVCSNMFSDVDARVACNSLGYGYTGHYIGNVYTPATYLWLDYVGCNGWESWIGYCPHNGWGVTSCNVWNVVSVSCLSSTTEVASTVETTTATTEELSAAATGTIDPYWSTRLVGSGVSWEGRLEVLYNGQWGAVCSNYFSDVDARVACNSLGYGYTGYYIGNMYTPANIIWLDYVNCYGWESWIGYCPHNGWGYTTCGSWSVVSIRCIDTTTAPETTTTAEETTTTTAPQTTETTYERTSVASATVDPYWSTRLVGSMYSWEGRLEVLYNGQWGAVCSNMFSDVDARVACNSLGYGYTGHYIGNVYTPATYIWLDYVGCNGWESWIGYCPHNGWGMTNCNVWNVVSVSCLSSTTETSEVASTVETTTATTAAELWTAATGTVDPYYSTRLVGSGVSWEGRLEVLYNGQWGAVCSNYFSDVDARVACNSLGYGYTGYYIGNMYTPANIIWLDYVNCYGWESWIGYCPHNGWGYTTCGSWSVVSIRCIDTTTAPETTTTAEETTTTTAPQTTETTYETTSVASSAVDPYWSTRLVGSMYSWEGRLEVLYNGQWGAVCSNSFSDVDARVACNSLGYGYTGYYIGNVYTPANYIWLDYVNCAGWESWIGYCPHNGWGYTSCSSWSVVSINCLEAASTTTVQTTTIARTTTANYYGATRLVGGYYSDRGRVEVLYNGVWGTVCDDSFDDTDARVVCNSLGFGYSGRFVGSLYGEGSGQIWLDEVGCYGYESFIGNCPHSGWGVHDCKHTEDVSVECFQATTAGQPPTTLTTKQVETTTTRGDTTTSPTTTGTTGTSTTTTTSPGFPDITSPFMEESLAGLMEAVDGTMTMSCLHRYTQQFQEVLKGQLERAKEEMVASSLFCEVFTDGKLITAYINMLQSGVEVGLMFGVDVISYGTDAISSIETCGWQLGDYLSDFNNWRQPIWTDINQCPRLVFTSSQFNVTEVNWKCHP